VTWVDRWRGRVEIDPSRIGGDFLVAREGVGPAYQLAVVHDDAAMGVTEVIRGDDLVPSTPRQILLFQALGHPSPSFGHVGLVYGPDGRRLAKREGAIKLATFREAGLDARAFLGWLARTLGQEPPDPASGPRGLLDRFDPNRVPSGPLSLRQDALDALGAGRVPAFGFVG
jgi:glutamyl-tRNA synthetase